MRYFISFDTLKMFFFLKKKTNGHALAFARATMQVINNKEDETN
jgi:hypothetical protein